MKLKDLPKRAQRRYHYKRLKRRALKRINLWWGPPNAKWIPERLLTHRQRWEGFFANTPKACAGLCCKRHSHHLGPKKQWALYRHEVEDAAQDWLYQWYDWIDWYCWYEDQQREEDHCWHVWRGEEDE